MTLTLPSVQQRRLDLLLERGGRVRSVKIFVETPNGSCTIDDFGHVEWLPKVLDAAQPLPHTTPNDKATQHQTP